MNSGAHTYLGDDAPPVNADAEVEMTRQRIHYPELLVIVGLAGLTRFWDLFHPRATVFDEVIFEKYASAYFSGQFYFDVHPPLGKLMFFWLAKLFGVSGATLAAGGPDAVMLRIAPALMGTILVPLIWLMLRQLGANRRIAAFGALLVVFDNALLVESRLVLMDIFLITAGFAALVLYLAARQRQGWTRGWLIAASAFCAGVSGSIKWTGLSALGIILLFWFIDCVRRRAWRRVVGEGALFVALPLAIYLSSFAVHFFLLHHAGPGDVFMSTTYQRTLVGDPRYDPAAHLTIVQKFRELHRVMREQQVWFIFLNPYRSRWYSWPLEIMPIMYWLGSKPAAAVQSRIYLLGNPAVWWGTTISLIVLAIAYWRRRELFARYDKSFAFLAFGYCLNYLPFIPITRSMYLYHYLNAVLFAIMLSAFGIGVLAQWDGDDSRFANFPSRRSAGVYWGLLAAVVLLFAWFSPISYGWQISLKALILRMWMPTWG